MRLSAPGFKLKRRAKLLARDHDIPLHQALDRIAREDGYRSWSHLASAYGKARPADRVCANLRAGDMLLVAARPGHGKTLLGLELAASASKVGRTGHIFSLDFNEGEVVTHFRNLGIVPDMPGGSVVIDTVDDICADHVIDAVGEAASDAIVVLDYLQILDQKRSNPDLDAQIRALHACARRQGMIVVMMSQIDRAFELTQKRLPDLSDVRLPNPVDLGLFNKTCFLHDGEMEIGIAA